MPDNAVYYMGRVNKLGKLTADMVVQSILKPQSVTWWGNGWSFFDAQQYDKDGIEFVCAKLSKFDPEGEVFIADPNTNQEIVQQEPNLRIASSHFIYIPSVSGIAFTKVGNHITELNFIDRFSRIVEETHGRFFLECDISLITDLRSFAEKLLSFSSIQLISAKLHPPNPLFGPLWKELKDYMASRHSEKMLIREDAGNEPLNTQLPEHVRAVADQSENQPYEPAKALPIGDAAILMAADGYGSGHVKGRRDNHMVVIRTSETIRNFEFDKDGDPHELFDAAYGIFKSIEKERHMEH